jgi:glycerol uptake facilitator-like aquaporin
VVYVVAQLVGAALAALLLRLILPAAVWRPSSIGLPLVNHAGGFTNGKAVLLEAVLTFLLVTMVFATAIDERGAFKSIAGFGIGLVLTMDILVGGPFTGASMNPARTFGPALVAGRWTDFWVYLAGPVLGGIVAATLYWYMFLRPGEQAALPSSEETAG